MEDGDTLTGPGESDSKTERGRRGRHRRGRPCHEYLRVRIKRGPCVTFGRSEIGAGGASRQAAEVVSAARTAVAAVATVAACVAGGGERAAPHRGEVGRVGKIVWPEGGESAA